MGEEEAQVHGIPTFPGWGCLASRDREDRLEPPGEMLVERMSLPAPDNVWCAWKASRFRFRLWGWSGVAVRSLAGRSPFPSRAEVLVIRAEGLLGLRTMTGVPSGKELNSPVSEAGSPQHANGSSKDICSRLPWCVGHIRILPGLLKSPPLFSDLLPGVTAVSQGNMG